MSYTVLNVLTDSVQIWIFKFALKLDQSPCTIVQGLWPNFDKTDEEKILHFYKFFDAYTMYMYVLMLCRKLELIPIKIGFYINFLNCSKIGPKTLYNSTGSLAKFHQKWQGENSLFLLYFLIHIHVLMLCRKFELIPIKIRLFTIFKSCSKIGPKSLY